ncbi:MAG TPA: hypothetical protein VHM19_03705 [Polyangiales bacterium]|jgi:hypothetical protein|nr:hypothetical protein [Polyangiales bacterium]
MNDTEATRTARDEQNSLAPVSLDRLSVEDEAKLMHIGEHGKLAIVALAVLLVGSGSLYFMKRLDTREAYVGAAAQVHKLRTEQLEPFLRCVLPDADRAQINSKENLISAIEAYGDRMGKDYSRMLAKCTPMVDDLPQQLAAVPAPKSVRDQMRGLSHAANDLRQAVVAYHSYLSNSGRQYDYVQALPLMEKIAVAWESYESRQAELDAAVKNAIN